jgi:hypothetical protein
MRGSVHPCYIFLVRTYAARDLMRIVCFSMALWLSSPVRSTFSYNFGAATSHNVRQTRQQFARTTWSSRRYEITSRRISSGKTCYGVVEVEHQQRGTCILDWLTKMFGCSKSCDRDGLSLDSVRTQNSWFFCLANVRGIHLRPRPE